MDTVALDIHFIGLNTQLFWQSKNSVLGRSHIRATNIDIINLTVLSKERIQESEAVQEAPQYKNLEVGRITPYWLALQLYTQEKTCTDWLNSRQYWAL